LGLLISINCLSQKLDHKQGEILLQIHPKYATIDYLLTNYQLFKRQETSLGIEKCLSETMNIWQLKFDFSVIDEMDFLAKLCEDSAIQNAQFNHFIELRNIPNDPDFIQQWQYINEGSMADLDADLAWDITTGGTTVNGDTIVLCALDNGVNINHQDIVDNLWKNHQEIPDNDIDDDGNGYIDDIFGWNAKENIGNLEPEPEGKIHGTPVMGIMGAKGNNGLGVTGVNWNAKLMMVKVVKTEFSVDEATIIAGYDYPLTMRKLYNESAGEKGAFVVATNASWGAENFFPEDAPIWCALYDSLGNVGILNCGATANRSIDVDIRGDLPSNCPSNYLIGVTSLDRTGQKASSAAYGKRNIDLGAFGERVYTLSRTDYDEFRGTSFATPHVAGAIGLLYATPCNDFGNLIKTSPAATALLVRNYILDGVKPNEALNNITVTGGQLNLNNSLQLLTETCGNCFLPLSVTTTNTVDTTTVINWIAPQNVKTIIRYRIKDMETWTEITSITAPFSLKNLQTCTNYEYQLKNDCAQTSSGYGEIYAFKTNGCGACTDLNYCISRTRMEDEWISRVSLNDLVNESGSDFGYGDFTGRSTDLTISETYDLTVSIGYASASFDENIQAWVDFNQDGIFDEVTENILNLDEDVLNEHTAQFQIPDDAVLGLTRMRIALKWRGGNDRNKSMPCDSYDFGEVEDYCVNIVSPIVSTTDFSEDMFSLNVQPNPFVHTLNIEALVYEAKDVKINLVDISGKLLYHEPKQKLNAGKQVVTLEVDYLPTGIYFLSLLMEGQQFSWKVIKS